MNEDYQEKMDPTHLMYLCRMLKVKELPEDLLGRYAQVKTLLDRIDGHFTPCGLAMIIVSVGDNPEIATELLGASDDKVIEEAVEQPVEKLVEAVAKKQREAEEPVSGATGQADNKPAESAKFWSPGMPVRALIDEELKKGKIVGIGRVTEEGNGPRLTVELEGGETVTCEEDEVEAV